MPEELIAALENRSVDRLGADECRERLALLFEKGLHSPLTYTETITMRHDVVRAIFPGLPSDLRGTPFLTSEGELISTGLASSLKKCLTVTGVSCHVITPVSFKVFLDKSPAFLDEQGHKAASRPVERVRVKFRKSYFTSNIQ